MMTEADRLIQGVIYLEYFSELEEETSSARHRKIKCSRAIVWDVLPVDSDADNLTASVCHLCGQVNPDIEAYCSVCKVPLKNKEEVFFQDIYFVYQCKYEPNQYTHYHNISLSEVRVFIDKKVLMHEGTYGQGIIEGRFEAIKKERRKQLAPSKSKVTSNGIKAQAKTLKSQAHSCLDSTILPIAIFLVAFALVDVSQWGSYGCFILALILSRRLRQRYMPYDALLLRIGSALGTLLPIIAILGLSLQYPCAYTEYVYTTILVSSLFGVFTYRIWPVLSFSALGAVLLYMTNTIDCEVEASVTEVMPEEDPMRDSDNDTIPDTLDQCPEIAEDFDGVEDSDGCPDLDNDQDGIPDIIDDCPNMPGSGLDGCPNAFDLNNQDSDEDGVSDLLDKCPEEKETLNHFNDSDGCPDELPEDLQEIAGELYIQFELNSSDIQEEIEYNVALLAKLMKALQKYDSLRIKIDGHTDNRGDDDFNQKLSESRAEATKEALCTQGIIECSRIQTQGYGSRQPLVPNESEENQATNRRVDISWFGEIDHSKSNPAPIEGNSAEENVTESNVEGDMNRNENIDSIEDGPKEDSNE